MGLSVKGVKQGVEIAEGAKRRKALRVGMCMGPGPKGEEEREERRDENLGPVRGLEKERITAGNQADGQLPCGSRESNWEQGFQEADTRSN
ncbi:hypothetical protein EAG_06046 [Camponotus floridanus]|uniref:Uncharacterized protein n=1 Tax=Camponotus floridanus TaxID=104421 RepID=E2AYN2_CAMFO|nr:hypothetical protein EAG_06046 [Camponotus floridanus]